VEVLKAYYPELEGIWSRGEKPQDYFGSLKNYRHLVLDLVNEVKVAPAEREGLAKVLAAGSGGFGTVRVAVLTEDWCGDSAVTLPYVTALFAAVDVEVRVFRQSVFTDLKQWYEADGTDHIPAVSVIAEASQPGPVVELMRWVERPQAGHAKVEGWLAAHPEMPELRAKKDTDKAASKEYFKLYAALLRDMSGWYRDGLWAEIGREFAEGLGKVVTQ